MRAADSARVVHLCAAHCAHFIAHKWPTHALRLTQALGKINKNNGLTHMTASTNEIAAERQAECMQKAAYFESKLRFFSKMNWITVLVPSLLAVIAGASIFATGKTIFLGIVALLAALLTAIHKGLECDSHQAECRRLVQSYRGLETRYRTISEIDMNNADDKLAGR